MRAAEVRFGVTTLVLGGPGLPPSDDRIVIVRAGVHHFSHSPVGQVHVRAFVAKTELQNRHARDLQAISQCVHFRRDIAEILGEEGQAA